MMPSSVPSSPEEATPARMLEMIRNEVDDFAAFFASAGPGADVGNNAISRMRCVLPKILDGSRPCALHPRARSSGEELPECPETDAKAGTAFPRETWGDDDHTVIWWNEASGETMLGYLEDVEDCEGDNGHLPVGYFTHFTRIVNPVFPASRPLSESPK